MTPRSMAVVWATATLVALGTVVSLVIAGLVIERRSIEVPRTPVVVIGSSLMRYAVPPGGEVLGDGRPHGRIAINIITERQTLALMSEALDRGAKTILVEENAFVFDFANRATDAAGQLPFAIQLEDAFQHFSDRGKIGLRLALDLAPTSSRIAPEPEDIDGRKDITPQLLRSSYPLHLHPPREMAALLLMVARARQRNAEIVLVAPPRSQMAARQIGVEGVQALQQRLRGLAETLGLPLFYPATAWPDDDFIDLGHFNRRGRARFAAELLQWWSKHA